MSRATINTGGIDFNLSEQASDNIARDTGTPMHIAILADFSGRKSRGEENLQSLSDRKLIEINRDNFDGIFSKLNVQLQLPVSDGLLSFKELDDLHPDFIYERIGLFDKLRALKRKLKKKDSFDTAAEEIQSWSRFKGEQSDNKDITSTEIPEGIPLPDNLLDAVLQGHDIQNQLAKGPLGNIDSLIKDIVSPFVETKADPRQQDMLHAVDEATSETMRAIMHHSDFQQLEASWRSLYWLIRNLETSGKLTIYLLDASQQEVQADLEKGNAASHLFQLLVESRKTAEGTPIGIIVGDYQLGNNDEDADLAANMAALAAAGNACWLSGGNEQLAGCPALSENIDPDNWKNLASEETQQLWQQVRELPYASHLALVAPRFLLRLPYGNKTASTEKFNYEELDKTGAHRFYLWGNGAVLATHLLAEGFVREGWNALPGQTIEVGDLPLHVYEEDGDTTLKPCAEVLLTDRASATLTSAGLMTLRSVRNKDSVRAPVFSSISIVPSTVKGFW
jgi:type VI secretion system protein ImpC